MRCKKCRKTILDDSKFAIIAEQNRKIKKCTAVLMDYTKR